MLVKIKVRNAKMEEKEGYQVISVDMTDLLGISVEKNETMKITITPPSVVAEEK